ncbi:hypothetical protein CD932_19945 [Janthinobacterium sp. PC23-8]|nr:hypothetical protein CD932_19945 [Janthinobacterium sp. PC23-8]
MALGYATQQRSLRAQSIKATLLPFVTGGREVSDRDKSGKMNLTPDNLKGLRRSYSIGTHLEFQTLLPRGTTILDGHKDDVQGKAGFRDNRKGPYLNYLFAAPPRGTALNAHVRLGESEFKADQDRAHEDHMYKNKHLWE